MVFIDISKKFFKFIKQIYIVNHSFNHFVSQEEFLTN